MARAHAREDRRTENDERYRNARHLSVNDSSAIRIHFKIEYLRKGIGDGC